MVARASYIIHSDVRGFLNAFVLAHQVTSGCLALFSLYLFLPIRKKELGAVLVAGLAIDAYFWPMRIAVHKQFARAFLAIGVGLGLVGYLATLWRAYSAKGEEGRLARLLALVGPILPLGFLFGGWMPQMAHLAQREVYDTYAYLLDSAIGFSPSFICCSIVRWSETGSWIFYGIYSHLSLFMILAVALCLTRTKEEGIYYDVLWALSLVAIGGTLLYNIYPITGPGNLFGSRYHGPEFVPWFTPEPGKLRMLEAPSELSRRGMPSLHATWGLLAVIPMLRQRALAWRVFGALFMIGTFISAAYIGHYFIDFLVAFPLALLTIGITAKSKLTSSRARIEAMLVGLVLLVLCYAVLFYGILFFSTHPVLFTLCEFAVLAIVVFFERRLYLSKAAE